MLLICRLGDTRPVMSEESTNPDLAELVRHGTESPERFRSASVFDFGSDDRVTRLRIYSDVDEALRAVCMR